MNGLERNYTGGGGNGAGNIMCALTAIERIKSYLKTGGKGEIVGENFL